MKYKCFFFLAAFTALAVNAGNIIANGSFESLKSDSNFPTDWGIHYIWKGPVTVVNDFGHAHDGSVSLHFNQLADNAHKTQLTIGSSRCATRPGTRYRLSVWAKGNGSVSMTAYFSSKGKYLSDDGTFPPANPLQSEFFTINSDEYRQITFTFTVPEILTAITADHEKLSPETVEILFNVKGDIYLDDVELYPADEVPPQEKAFVSDPDRPTLMTIPRLPNAPEIDGKLTDAVWQQASATTGFRAVGGILSPKQTIVYAGYDDENLYIAFTALQLPGSANPGFDREFESFPSDVEGFEIWLAPDGQRWYQLLLVPGGGFLSNSADGDTHWGRQTRYAATYIESTMMFGGILATDSRTWFGEVVIPFSALGMTTPADGSELRINFCRDIATEKSTDARSSEDWTSWSEVTGFNNVARYGYLRFDSRIPGIQCITLNDPSNGSVALAGRSLSQNNVQTRIRLPQFNNRILQTSSGNAGANGEFNLNDEIQVSGSEQTPMVLDFSVSDQNGKVLSQNSVPFILMPAFGLNYQLFYSAKKVEVTADYARLSHSDGCKIIFSVTGANQNQTASGEAAVSATDRNSKYNFDITNWAPGQYTLTVQLFDPAGKLLAGNTCPLEIPAKPAWMDNPLWQDRSVPAPYTPIVQNGTQTSVVLRTYTWQNNGLPQRVSYQNHELFAAPAQLVLKVNGRAETLQFQPLEVLESSEDLVQYKIKGLSASVELTGTLDVEFDGFARWKVELKARRPGVRVTEFSLNFPITREDALFMRGDGYTGSLLQDRYTRSPRPSPVVHIGNAETMWGNWKYDASGWNWTDKFFHELVIGSDHYAFSVMCEDNEFVRGNKYASVSNTTPGASVLTVTLVSEPTLLDNKPLKYDYFFQTLPIRPEPTDPKRWHAALDPSSIFTINLPGYLNTPEGQRLLDALYVGESYHDLAPSGFSTWAKDPQASEAALAKFHSHGMKIASNLWYAVMPEICPEYRIFGAEWRAYPEYYWTTPTSMMRSVCLNSAFADFHIENVAKIILETPFDGVYTDATAVFCNNGHHGCGWTDANGVRHADLNLLATRRFVKQMYRLLKRNGADKINFNHNGESPSTAGFVDIRTDGEELIWEGKEHYRRITPDYFRSTYAQNEYGIPYTFHAVFHYSWRRVGDVVPVREVLMMTLPHRVSFTLAYDVETLPVWEIVDPWWTTSDFRAYWYANCPVTTDIPTEMLSSVFIKQAEKKALVIFSNWSFEDRTARWQIDTGKLGFDVKSIYEIDTITGERRPVALDALVMSLKSRDFAIVELSGE